MKSGAERKASNPGPSLPSEVFIYRSQEQKPFPGCVGLKDFGRKIKSIYLAVIHSADVVGNKFLPPPKTVITQVARTNPSSANV